MTLQSYDLQNISELENNKHEFLYKNNKQLHIITLETTLISYFFILTFDFEQEVTNIASLHY